MNDQERVAALSVRACLAIKLGLALLEAASGPCDCRYADGLPRFVDAGKKMVHRCGR